MSNKHERLISLIDLIIKSVYSTTDHKAVYTHLEEMLKQIKFDSSSINIEQFEDTLFFALKEYIKHNLLTENLENKVKKESSESKTKS